VFPIGDRFLEIVAPTKDGTTAGRLLEKDGSGGYMAIFQIDDFAGARKRAADLGIRTVWEAELEDISAAHLHPKDIGGAIVSIDRPDPPQSWRWGGPEWIGADVPQRKGGLRGLAVRVDDPDAVADRWATVLGLEANDGSIKLDDGRQEVRFVAADGERTGISEIRVDIGRTFNAEIGGVRFTS
jgi:hypothetical protein